MLRQVLEDRPQVLRRRHIDTAPDLNLIRRHAEVIAGAAVFLQIPARKNSRDVRLVRSFILAEARVAVDAVNGFVRIAHMVRSEVGQPPHERGDQLEHRPLHLLVVDVFARLEPFARIVLLQAAEKRHGFRRESAKTRVHAGTSSIMKSMSGTEETLRRLAAVPSLQVSSCVPLSRYTRFGIGGPADIFAETRDVEAFIAAMHIARSSGLNFVVIGGGTNLIVSDAGFRGVALRLIADRLMAAGNRVVCDAGVVLQDLVDFSIERGLKGLETLAGIPGWVGAAVYGNAGAYGHSLSERVHKVRFLDGGQVRVFDNQQCEFH